VIVQSEHIKLKLWIALAYSVRDSRLDFFNQNLPQQELDFVV
jgi:hypothetical protein